MGKEGANVAVEPHKGAVYSITKKEVRKQIPAAGISNGLAWNDDLKKFYYIDTHNKTVDEYDFDIVTGTICKFKISSVCFFFTEDIRTCYQYLA